MITRIIITLSLCMVASGIEAAPLGTAFCYQGFLSGAGTPATGTFDFQFSLSDAANNGNQVGPRMDMGDLPDVAVGDTYPAALRRATEAARPQTKPLWSVA